MFPLQDNVPTRKFSVVTAGIILINILVFAFQYLGGGGEEMVRSVGLIPSMAVAHPFGVDTLRRVITSMFTHGGLMHIGSNMLYLWIFGNNIEDVLGKFRFVLFYFLAGAAAAAAQTLINPTSTIPMVGASGAVAGVLGAYLLLYPNARVKTLIFFGFFARIANMSALWILGSWFVLQLISGLQSVGIEQANMGGVAFWAHIGGFIAGMVMILPILQKHKRRRRY